jgi:2-aminoadipate transaminase
VVRILSHPPGYFRVPATGVSLPPPPVPFSEKARRTPEQPIGYFMRQAVENSDLISLAAGFVDSESLPSAEVSAALDEVLANPQAARAALQYGTTQGFAPLREKLLARVTALDRVNSRDIAVTPDDVVVTTGSQQLLYLVSELLLDPGDFVITEAPSYFVYQAALASQGVGTLPVPVDQDGMNTEVLEERLVQLERAGDLDRLRLIYVCDYFQNPSGLSLSLERRQRLVELVKRFSHERRIFILEDAAYRELRYDGSDLPSIKSFDRDNAYVILGLSFSKSFAPGLKTGYGLLPRELVAPFLRLKGNHDFGSNNLTQHLLDRLLSSGAYDRQVASLRRVYAAKRDLLLGALKREFSDWPDVRWTRPSGGLYVWLTFPRDIDTGPQGPMMPAAVREGVLYVPGQLCYVANRDTTVPTNEARLSFGIVKRDQIEEAVRRLTRAARARGPEEAGAAVQSQPILM